jgi:hypothetical protein
MSFRSLMLTLMLAHGRVVARCCSARGDSSARQGAPGTRERRERKEGASNELQCACLCLGVEWRGRPLGCPVPSSKGGPRPMGRPKATATDAFKTHTAAAAAERQRATEGRGDTRGEGRQEAATVAPRASPPRAGGLAPLSLVLGCCLCSNGSLWLLGLHSHHCGTLYCAAYPVSLLLPTCLSPQSFPHPSTLPPLELVSAAERFPFALANPASCTSNLTARACRRSPE